MKAKKEINIIVGQNIKAERERAGYTQEQFSELIGLGPKSLSAIERGVVGISLTSLQRICKVLSISSDTILFGNADRDDLDDIVHRLKHLTPTQLKVMRKSVMTTLEAFAINE